jgi:hypothetical protein
MVMKMNPAKNLPGQSNRNVYKSIVIGMSIYLSPGIGFGVIKNHIAPGVLAGNTAGPIPGITISRFNRNKNR